MFKDLNSSSQPIRQASKVVYDYWRECAKNQPATKVIEEFKSLFLQGRNDVREVSSALEKVIFTTAKEEEFYVFFTNCFYVIFDCWTSQPEFLYYVSELVNSLEIINRASSYDRRRKQLIKLIKNYQESETYFQLRAILSIINPQKIANVALASGIVTDAKSTSKNYADTNINTYLARYTYLYSYLAPLDTNLERLNKFIQSLQASRQRDFEFKLSKHIIYRFRLKEVARIKMLSQGHGKLIIKADNPSILSESAFRVALQQYIGKVESKQTIQERSQRFVADHKFRDSYQVFKQDLHRFLCHNIKPRQNNYNFDAKLAAKLEQIFPQSDRKPLNSTLILQTSRQLFSYLIVDPATANFSKFVELITNLGTAQVMMILIKIALICPESKADLEKKIALVVTHYQMHSIQDTPWLIKTLEHLLMAFGIYFGNIDVSIAKSAIGNQKTLS